MAGRPADSITLGLNRQAQNSVDAYIQYHHIIADAPDDKLLTDAELAEYMRTVAIKRSQNRIYVTYINSNTQRVCRTIGPESKCFCGCAYKRHDTDSGSAVMPCKNKQCQCTQYEHIPVHGSIQLRCRCMHTYTDHSVISIHACNKCSCSAFDSPQSCVCGDRLSAHRTLFETRAERIAAGKPVDNLGMASATSCYAAMGGITNFSSLVPNTQSSLVDNSNSSDTVQPARRTKLSEAEEMALYASNYKSASSKSTRRHVPQRRTATGANTSTAAAHLPAGNPNVLRDIANEYADINQPAGSAGSTAPLYTNAPQQSVELRQQIRAAKLNAQRNNQSSLQFG